MFFVIPLSLSFAWANECLHTQEITHRICVQFQRRALQLQRINYIRKMIFWFLKRICIRNQINSHWNRTSSLIIHIFLKKKLHFRELLCCWLDFYSGIQKSILCAVFLIFFFRFSQRFNDFHVFVCHSIWFKLHCLYLWVYVLHENTTFIKS